MFGGVFFGVLQVQDGRLEPDPQSLFIWIGGSLDHFPSRSNPNPSLECLSYSLVVFFKGSGGNLEPSSWLDSGMNEGGDTHFQDFFLLFLSILKKEELEILCVMIWSINQVIHSPFNFRNEDVFGWATSFLRDYQAANLIARPPMSSTTNGSLILWCAPLEGIYTNDAVQDRNQRIRIGAIVRDSKDQVMASSVQIITVYYSPPVTVTEATAILRGLHFAVDVGLTSVVLKVIQNGLWI
ncbi:hypothetical protein Dsin_006074 [Dipteronia sinensis]|uniref:RNase H type-1 domain-containing protein n=1 Tax=Dipteronia sinensis TaxID=43782 RepID=A0AAE0AYZ5_9ROSI|nr:hypothetical protein Dsin_006074 [Dipteronia sinensis]